MTGGSVTSDKAIEITSRMPHGRVYCDGANISIPLPFAKQFAYHHHLILSVWSMLDVRVPLFSRVLLQWVQKACALYALA